MIGKLMMLVVSKNKNKTSKLGATMLLERVSVSKVCQVYSMTVPNQVVRSALETLTRRAQSFLTAPKPSV